jgi:hypothetical protein
MLCAPNCKHFTLPVEVLQTQFNGLAAAEAINSEQQNEGLGAKVLGFAPLGQFQQLADLRPGWPHGTLLFF